MVVEGATGQHLRSKCHLAFHSWSFRVRDSRCGRESRKQQVRDKVAGPVNRSGFHRCNLHCGAFAAPSRLSLVSLLPLWLMPSLPGLWVFVGGPLFWQVCCGAIFFPFLNNGFNGAPWDVQSFRFFLITHPWSVLLHNFVPGLFGDLLGLQVAAC